MLSLHHSHHRHLAATATPKRQTAGQLRHAISYHRNRTWHYQLLAGRPRTITRYAERRTRSLPFLRWINRRWMRRQVRERHRYLALRTVASPAGVPGLICRVFGSACSEAVAVARCESHFETWAQNGQYLGIFQMGSSERARYATIGYATAYEQIVAAHNYFLVAGWGPWTCA